MEKIYRLNLKLLTNISHIAGRRHSEIMEATNIGNGTFYGILQKPEAITVQQLLSISNGLRIPISRFFSTDNLDLLEPSDEYVLQHYIPCIYKGDVLQHYADARIIQWKDIATFTGVSRNHVRDSLLFKARLPVERLLTVVNHYHINLFQVLIDPNPSAEQVKKQKQKFKRIQAIPPTDFTTLHQIIDQLRTDLDNARRIIDDNRRVIDQLTTQYNSLQSKHEVLEKRINNATNNTSIAAETKTDTYNTDNKNI